MFEYLLSQVPEIDPITVGWINVAAWIWSAFLIALGLGIVAAVAFGIACLIELWWAIRSRRRQRRRRIRWPTEDPDEPYYP